MSNPVYYDLSAPIQHPGTTRDLTAQELADFRDYYARKAAKLAQDAAADGIVLTIEQRPLMPLAMGHYESLVSARLDGPTRKAVA